MTDEELLKRIRSELRLASFGMYLLYGMVFILVWASIFIAGSFYYENSNLFLAILGLTNAVVLVVLASGSGARLEEHVNQVKKDLKQVETRIKQAKADARVNDMMNKYK